MYAKHPFLLLSFFLQLSNEILQLLKIFEGHIWDSVTVQCLKLLSKTIREILQFSFNCVREYILKLYHSRVLFLYKNYNILILINLLNIWWKKNKTQHHINLKMHVDSLAEPYFYISKEITEKDFKQKLIWSYRNLYSLVSTHVQLSESSLTPTVYSHLSAKS